MKNLWKNYKSTIILLVAIIVGAIVGAVFKEKAKVLAPLGDLFLNLMFIIIIPLVFLNISTSIVKMSLMCHSLHIRFLEKSSLKKIMLRHPL